MVTRSDYWILEKNVDLSGSPFGVCPTDTAAVACFRGAQCLVEDEHLRKHVISGGSATIDIRANNGYDFHHCFSKPKNLTNKGFAKSRMRLSQLNKYKPQQYGLSRIAALVLSNQFSAGTLTYDYVRNRLVYGK